MSNEADSSFVSASDESVPYTNQDAAKEDQIQEESEATGKIPSSEVEELKDSMGGGKVLDDSEGYTRSSNADVDPLKQEREVDAAVDAEE